MLISIYNHIILNSLGVQLIHCEREVWNYFKMLQIELH